MNLLMTAAAWGVRCIAWLGVTVVSERECLMVVVLLYAVPLLVFAWRPRTIEERAKRSLLLAYCSLAVSLMSLFASEAVDRGWLHVLRSNVISTEPITKSGGQQPKELQIGSSDDLSNGGVPDGVALSAQMMDRAEASLDAVPQRNKKVLQP